MFAKIKAAVAASRQAAKDYACARWPEKSTLLGLGGSLGASTATVAALNLPADAARTMAALVVVVGLAATLTPTTKAPAARPADQVQP